MNRVARIDDPQLHPYQLQERRIIGDGYELVRRFDHASARCGEQELLLLARLNPGRYDAGTGLVLVLVGPDRSVIAHTGTPDALLPEWSVAAWARVPSIYAVVREANTAHARGIRGLAATAEYLSGRFESVGVLVAAADGRLAVDMAGAGQHDVRWSALARTWYPHLHAEPGVSAPMRDGE
jgi:hypothetical protein